MYMTDFVLNGKAHGDVADGMASCRWEPGLRRPFYNERGQKCVTIKTGRMVLNKQTGLMIPEHKTYKVADLIARDIHSPVFNASTLTKQAWQYLDDAVLMATRQRLSAWPDLVATSSRGGFDAMSTMTFEYQAMNDVGQVVVDMNGISDGQSDRNLFNLTSIPLPITHSDFYFTLREVMISRRTGQPLDRSNAEQATRRVMEQVEQTLIGTIAGIEYGGVSAGPTAHRGSSKVYGYTNFPYRITKTDLNAPTGSNPEAVMTDILEMTETMRSNGFFGPYMLYHSTPYSRYLEDDYFRTGSTSAVRDLRSRIMDIQDIQDIRRFDYLTSGYQLLLIQMTSDVAEAIDGMKPTLVMWEEEGGMLLKFKVMAIQVPLLKAPYNGIAGILHGTTS